MNAKEWNDRSVPVVVFQVVQVTKDANAKIVEIFLKNSEHKYLVTTLPLLHPLSYFRDRLNIFEIGSIIVFCT